MNESAEFVGEAEKPTATGTRQYSVITRDKAAIADG
jgi:hypothetical protein